MMMMTAFASQNNGNPLLGRLPSAGGMVAQPRAVVPFQQEQPPLQPVANNETPYTTPYQPDAFIPQAQPVEGSQTPATVAYPVPEVYPSSVQQPALQENNPYPEYTAGSPAHYTQPLPPTDEPYANYPAYPDYSATYPTAYPSYDAYANYPAYPTYSPSVAIANKPAKPPKRPMGIFEKLLWGTLATAVTGATAFAIFENRERLFQSFPANVVSHTKGFFSNLWQGIDGKVTAPATLQETLKSTVTQSKEGAFQLLNTLETYIANTQALGHTAQATTLQSLKQEVETLLQNGTDLSALTDIKNQFNQTLVPISKSLTQYPEELALLTKLNRLVVSPNAEAQQPTLVQEVKNLIPELEAALKRATDDKKKAQAIETASEKIKKASTALEAHMLFAYFKPVMEKNLVGREKDYQEFTNMMTDALKAKKFDQVRQQLLAPIYTQELKAHLLLQSLSLSRVITHLEGDSQLPVDAKIALGRLMERIKQANNSPQDLVLGGGLDQHLAEVLDKNNALKTKIDHQLGLLGVVPTERDTTAKQATVFLGKFSGVADPDPVTDMLKDVAAHRDQLLKQLKDKTGTSLTEAMDDFETELGSSPERKTALMGLLQQRSVVINKGIKKFETAYRGNAKVTPEQLATLKNTFLTALWQNPENMQPAQDQALAKASWWGKNRLSWMPF
jgi:hypothetical protein